MLTRPADLPEVLLREVLADGWHFRTARLSYQAVGFGSHHWLSEEAGGERLFVTVDDLDGKRRSEQDTTDAAFRRLAGAFESALGLGEYFQGQSDVDFTSVLASRPDAGQLEALAAAHDAVHAAHPEPHFDGVHLIREDLRRPPEASWVGPRMFDGKFTVGAAGGDINLVSWHELARHGITIRGPELTEAGVWTDDAALRARERADEPSPYDDDARRRDTKAFTAMALEAALALGPA